MSDKADKGVEPSPKEANPKSSEKGKKMMISTGGKSVEKHRSPKVPNSAVGTGAKNGAQTEKTGESQGNKVTKTGKTNPVKQKLSKQDNSDSAGGDRMDKLEAMLQQQAKQNQVFQHHILDAMAGMMNKHSDASDDDGIVDYVDNHDTAQDICTSHPISEEEDDVNDIPSGSGHGLSLLKKPDGGQSNNSMSSNVKDNANTNTNDTLTQGGDSQSKCDKPSEDGHDGGFADIFAADTDAGGVIRQDLAATLEKALVNPYDEKKVQEAMNKVKKPENCPALVVPKVNLPIWSNIRSKTRSTDLKLQRVQKPLIKGLTALAKLDQNQALTQDLKEAFLLLSVANFELNCARKDMIKPDLNPEFHHLCSPKNKVTEWLFGNDLGKQVKDLQEESKATRGVMRGGSSNRGRGRGSVRFQPYPKFNSSLHAAAAAAGWTKNPFLGQTQRGGKPQQWTSKNNYRSNTAGFNSTQIKSQQKKNANSKK